VNTLFIAILSIALSVLAQFALKAGMSSADVKEVMAQPLALRTIITVFSNRFVLGGFFLYGVGAIVWLAVLSKWDVSKAYPLVGMGFGLTVIVGLLAGEQVTLLRTGGVALICAGVILVGKS
jgi:multidrug transporter EmrE-like cation transporter